MAEKVDQMDPDEKIVEIAIERLRVFENHPFRVEMDSQMKDLQDSIKKYGIITPVIVRPRKEGYYEIISGHRRIFAAEKLGYRKVPSIIRYMTDDQAVIAMVDSNLQRERIQPSEKAFAYKMKYDVLKRKSGRRKAGQVDHNSGKKGLEIISEETGDSPKQVQRYIKMADLIPELLEKVDDGSMGFTPAVQIAYLKKKEQKDVLDADRVKIACMTGGLGALCSSDHDHVWRSASYYALSQLMEYAKGTSMQTSVECETYDMPGYAIDDTSQYRGKENVPYVDSASAWDRENGRLNLFVLNRNEESEYSLTVDVRGFEGYRFVKQFEMYTDDLEASSSFDNPSLVLPKEKEDILFADGRLTTSLKPLSWNVLCFEKEEE